MRVDSMCNSDYDKHRLRQKRKAVARFSNRFWGRSLALVLLLVTCTPVVVFLGEKSPETRFEQICEGMDRAEVRALMGWPASYDVDNFLAWEDGRKLFLLELDGESVINKGIRDLTDPLSDRQGRRNDAKE